MLGILINDMEKKEMEYLIKRELDELLFDLDDQRIDAIIKHSMKERYETLFRLLLRVANKEDCLHYMPAKIKNKG